MWATAQHPARSQRQGRYVEISGHHPAKMLPAIAARAVATYTRPGDLVVDPMCGIGSTLVENLLGEPEELQLLARLGELVVQIDRRILDQLEKRGARISVRTGPSRCVSRHDGELRTMPSFVQPRPSFTKGTFDLVASKAHRQAFPGSGHCGFRRLEQGSKRLGQNVLRADTTPGQLVAERFPEDVGPADAAPSRSREVQHPVDGRLHDVDDAL